MPNNEPQQTSCTFTLKNTEATLALGDAFGRALSAVLLFTGNADSDTQSDAHSERQNIDAANAGVCLCMDGALGAGKTTLTRGLVGALPRGNEAEVSSPSFTICNEYATLPPCAHCDLYRLDGMSPDDGILDMLDALDDDTPAPYRPRLVIMEWAEYLPARFLPRHVIHIQWHNEGNTRRLICTASTPLTEEILRRTLTFFQAQNA